MNRLAKNMFRLQTLNHRTIRTSVHHLQQVHKLHLTDSARVRLEHILEKDEFLRVKVNSGGCSGFQYDFSITKDKKDDDIVSDVYILTDETSLELIKGSYVDYYKETIRSAFGIINNPQATDGCSCGASFSIDINSF